MGSTAAGGGGISIPSRLMITTSAIPTALPATTPSAASHSASNSSRRASCERLVPIASSVPSSRMRSSTDISSVFALDSATSAATMIPRNTKMPV